MSASAIDPAADFAAEAARIRERRRIRGRIWIFAALVVLFPAASLFGLLLWTHLEDRRLVAEALDRARAAGDPLTTAEMQALFYPPSASIDETTEQFRRAVDRHSAAMKLADEEAMFLFWQWGMPKYAAMVERDARGFYTEEWLARVDRLLSGPGEEALQAARAATRTGSIARMSSDVPTTEVTLPADDNGGPLGETPMSLCAIQVLFCLDAERHAFRGDTESATDDLVAMIAMANAFAVSPASGRIEGSGISSGLSDGLVSGAFVFVRELIDRVDFTDEQLRRLDAAVAALDAPASFIRSIQAEQYRVVRAFETNEPTNGDRLEGLRAYPFSGADEALAIGLLQDVLDAAKVDLVQSAAVVDRVKARREEIDASAAERFHFSGTLIATNALEFRYRRALETDARRSLIRAAIACERHRLRHGAWPTALEALVPELLDEAPQDPYDGNSLRIEVEGERLILRSIGQSRPENLPPQDPRGDQLTVVLQKPQRP